MKIRTKLTITFTTIVIVVLSVISLSIYFFSSSYRENDFRRRLRNRAINIARVLVEVKEMDIELLKKLEKNNPASLPNQHVLVYDSSMVLLYSSEEEMPVTVPEEEVKNITEDQQVYRNENGYETIGFVYSAGPVKYKIIATASDIYGLDALRHLSQILVSTLLASLAIVGMLGWFYAGRMLKPISSIVEEVENISGENLTRKLQTGNSRDELHKLAVTFNKMLERISKAIISQRAFIANASHEIKTPITVMTGQIEVTMLQERENSYYKKTLLSVLDGLRSLNRLSNQLLTLTQTSADQPVVNIATIRIDDLLWEVKEELTRMHEQYHVDIQFGDDVTDESLIVNGDEQLLRVAIMNLADNGCKYSYDGKVTITIHVNDENKIQLSFSNSGNGIPQQIIDKVFDPFVRGTTDKKIKGSGIGLSLVKSILMIHQGNVQVESSPLQQTTFTISLPLAIRKKSLISI
jgi:signal transduction histidine kinase